MCGELLGTPPIIDDRDECIGLAPVVDVLSIVGHDMTVSGAVGSHESSVEELEPITTTGCTSDDFDFVAVELSIAEHTLHHFRVGKT